MADPISHFDYRWSEEIPHTLAYLIRPLLSLLQEGTAPGCRILDLGCGNGALSAHLSRLGYQVVGVDPSVSGIAVARRSFPAVAFHQAPAAPDALQALELPPFDVVISTEVVEHCYAPRQWATAAFGSLRTGGRFICSTPYHGYWKNLALALSGKLDGHFTALWDGGHIKFFSRPTLTELLSEAGFVDLKFMGAGRCPWFWKSMLMAGRRP
ncbi:MULTISPECIES: class I SAM-dependent methyltransferase [Aphanothece]|uniref:class I SAM-dependent methyltransferase n=1 Tax=Aphanothece TaxID=1121 RepID=UPI00398527B2